MKVATVEKPMYFACDCGEKFMLGVWNYIERDHTMVVRWLNNIAQFQFCPFCGGKMSGKEMRLEHGPF